MAHSPSGWSTLATTFSFLCGLACVNGAPTVGICGNTPDPSACLNLGNEDCQLEVAGRNISSLCVALCGTCVTTISTSPTTTATSTPVSTGSSTQASTPTTTNPRLCRQAPQNNESWSRRPEAQPDDPECASFLIPKWGCGNFFGKLDITGYCPVGCSACPTTATTTATTSPATTGSITAIASTTPDAGAGDAADESAGETESEAGENSTKPSATTSVGTHLSTPSATQPAESDESSGGSAASPVVPIVIVLVLLLVGGGVGASVYYRYYYAAKESAGAGDGGAGAIFNSIGQANAHGTVTSTGMQRSLNSLATGVESEATQPTKATPSKPTPARKRRQSEYDGGVGGVDFTVKDRSDVVDQTPITHGARRASASGSSLLMNATTNSN